MDGRIFENIMVATDGSEMARKAVDSAVKIAKLNNAKLYAVNVIAYREFPEALPKDVGWEHAVKEHLMDEGKKATTYVEDTGKNTGIEVESVILEGSPANEIVDFADKNDIDLIIMGTLGKTGIQRFLLGSVAENVIRHSKKPVLIVR